MGPYCNYIWNMTILCFRKNQGVWGAAAGHWKHQRRRDGYMTLTVSESYLVSELQGVALVDFSSHFKSEIKLQNNWRIQPDFLDKP